MEIVVALSVCSGQAYTCVVTKRNMASGYTDVGNPLSSTPPPESSSVTRKRNDDTMLDALRQGDSRPPSA